MTVIAWDNEDLVADGRSTIGYELVSDKNWKLRQVCHPDLGEYIGAFCGAVMVVEPWIEHIKTKGFEKFELPEKEFDNLDTAALLVAKNGNAIELTTDGLWGTVTHPVAYGSGSTVAQHYLNSGASALVAVREAIKSNTSCGGQIVAWNWKEGKFRVYAK